ncbi:DUF6507 family protein [Streptomyces sp. NPDC088348]|uniref:DUF6507 family protein n=1 Tax=Streptomyces sp. NPDC088348 TaxID=3365853 RepID=UPI0037FBC396
MTAWDISVSGVRGVLSRTETAAEGLSDACTSMEKTLPSAASSAGTISGTYCGAGPPSGPVAAALAEFHHAKQRDLVYVAQRTIKSLNGASEATHEYLKGNVEMAANVQRTAVKEPVIHLPGEGKKSAE